LAAIRRAKLDFFQIADEDKPSFGLALRPVPALPLPAADLPALLPDLEPAVPETRRALAVPTQARSAYNQLDLLPTAGTKCRLAPPAS